ncbi:uncharacterized protein LOC117123912 [Anneissia japonica]|uniref:uncharacterized protein LOC117123912 n=1 Tax=Anneissia japonica TaxID=1529436 RepID=UPI00142567FE|nr:uncharacterized protein LOC117123912 [Anneissia japonica]
MVSTTIKVSFVVYLFLFITEITAKGYVNTEISFRLNTQGNDVSGIIMEDDFKMSLSDDLKMKYDFSSEADFDKIKVEMEGSDDLIVSLTLVIDYFNDGDTKAKDNMIAKVDAGRYEFMYGDNTLTSVAGTLDYEKDWRENWYHIVHNVTIMLFVALFLIALFLVGTWYMWVSRGKKQKVDRTVHSFTN